MPARKHIAPLLHFNSIKVRLELNGRQISDLLLTLFQFHKGAIRTETILSLYEIDTNISIP